MKFKFTPKVALIAIAFMLFSFSSFSQVNRELHISRIDNTLSDTVTFNVWGNGLVNIVAMQFSVDYDTTKLTYIGYTLPTTNFGIISSEVSIPNTLKPAKKMGGIGLLHFDATLGGQSVADGTVFMTVSFKFTNGYSKNVIDSVIFGSYPTSPIEIDTVDNAANPTPVTSFIYNGYVSTPFLPTIAHGSNGLLVANTPSTVPPASYQWYILTGIGGPGSTYTYTAIPGATSSSIVGASGVRYNVVAIYANGDRDTASSPVLPLKLNNFNGKNKDRANLLSWTATNEFNVASYIVERSVDGANFTDIGSVKSSVNSQDYSFTDGNLTASFSYYYRLKMIDAAGAFSYSSVVKLNKQGKLVFQIQPNPVENSTINLYGNNMKQVNVYDVNGKLMLNTLVTNPDQASIKMNNLTKGVYMINVISTEGVSQTEKFIVK